MKEIALCGAMRLSELVSKVSEGARITTGNTHNSVYRKRGEEGNKALVLTGVVRGRNKRECCFYVDFVRW
jgi:hypothetical protein